MAVGVGDWGDRDFWKEVAMELESGKLSEWREDRLLEPGAGDCSGEAVEVEDFFLWDDMDGVELQLDGDLLLYGVVDAEDDSGDYVSRALVVWEEDTWWDGDWRDCCFMDGISDEEDFLDLEEVLDCGDLWEKEPECSLLQWVSDEEFFKIDSYGCTAPVEYRITWDTNNPVEGSPSDLSGLSPERCRELCRNEGKWSLEYEGLCWVREGHVLGLGQRLLPVISGIVGNWFDLCLSGGWGLCEIGERPEQKPPWWPNWVRAFNSGIPLKIGPLNHVLLK